MSENRFFYLKQIIKATIISLFALFFSKLFAYAYRFLVARIGPEEYGLLSIGLAIFGFATAAGLLGYESGIVRPLAEYLGKNKREKVWQVIVAALKIALPVSLIITGIMFIFVNQITAFFHDDRLKQLIYLFAICVPIYTIYRIFLSVFRAFKKVDYEAIVVTGIENGLRVLFTGIGVYLGWRLFGVGVIYAICLGIGVITAIILVKRLVPKPKILETLSKKESREILFFSLPLMFNTLAAYILGWTDTIMIGHFMNAREVGIYNTALPTANILGIIPIAILGVFIPIATELWIKHKKKDVENMYHRLTKWIAMSNLMVVALIALFSKEIIETLFGQAYAEASIALPILLAGYFAFSLSQVPTNMLNVVKKTKTIFYNTLIAGGLNLILNFFLVQKFGLVGAAISTTISYMIFTILCFGKVWKETNIKPLKNRDSMFFSAIGIAYLVAVFYTVTITTIFGMQGITAKVGAFIILSIIYGLLLWLGKVFETDDILLIKEIKQRLTEKINGTKKKV